MYRVTLAPVNKAKAIEQYFVYSPGHFAFGSRVITLKYPCSSLLSDPVVSRLHFPTSEYESFTITRVSDSENIKF